MTPKILSIRFWYFIGVISFIGMGFASAQENIISKQNLYWVYFIDKSCSSDLIHHPEQFLSTKSIERRNRQQIKINQKDLPVCLDYIDELDKLGYDIIAQSKWLNAVVLDLANQAKPQKTFIKKIEPAKKYRLNAGIDSNSSLEEKETTFQKKTSYPKNYNYEYGEAATQLNMLNSACLHDAGFWGECIDIAIFDAGFRNADKMEAFRHLFEKDKIASIYDFVEDDKTVFDEGNSTHGTSVWSTMGAMVTGQYAGAAPEANYHLLKTEDISSETLTEEFNWIKAAEYADSIGVDIINSSLGYSLFDDSLQNHTYADMDGNTTPISIAADVAASKGILVVTSAGNSGDNPWTYITAPADADSILAVGSVDADKIKSKFSSFGPSSDGDIKPELAAMGSKTIIVKTNGDLGEAYGTSISSPLIAGMAACLWQKFPDKNNMEIMDLMKKSASQYKQPDTLLGYGIPDFCIAQLNLASNNLENPLLVYPNPFSNSVFVTVLNSLSGVGEHTVEFYTISGKLINFQSQTEQASNRQTFTFNNLQALPAGIYCIKYSNGSSIYHSKILKLVSN